MRTLRVHLFGKFGVCYGDQALTGFDMRKVQELFCYVLLYRDLPHSREALASLLWDEDHTEHPIRCLRKTLWRLRAALDSQVAPLSGQVLLIEPDWVQLNPQAELWLDVADFEATFARVQDKSGDQLDHRQAQELRSAAELYRGGLQENWYYDWYLYERERLQHMYLMILDKLMSYCETHKEYEAGLAYGTLVLRCERAHERTYRRLMRLYYLAGDRTAALRQYEQCTTVLHRELGVSPTERTRALYEQIRSDQLSAPRQLVYLKSVPSSADPELSELLGRLTQIQADFSEIQHRLSQVMCELKTFVHANADGPPTVDQKQRSRGTRPPA